ncbi:hypothetical protein [Streptomyces sp. NPDC048584]|uniref:hypothetical protein n=1 Tax=Streptomyces sp. NPDC048584 TaxID=3365573 RepID=UPI003719354A
MILILLLVFAVFAAVVWAVAIVADVLVGRRPHIPERWAVHIPGRFPAYVRQDYARARKAMARTLTRPSTPED